MSEPETYDFPVPKPASGPNTVFWAIFLFVAMVPVCGGLTFGFAQIFKGRSPQRNVVQEMAESKIKRLEAKQKAAKQSPGKSSEVAGSSRQ